MFKYQCDKGNLSPIFEDSGSSAFDEAIARINSQSSAEDVLNVLLDVFKNTASATPLYDQLVAGDFNGLQWEQFADMCGRIVQEENVPWKDIHEYIFIYLDENEPSNGYNWDTILQAA